MVLLVASLDEQTVIFIDCLLESLIAQVVDSYSTGVWRIVVVVGSFEDALQRGELERRGAVSYQYAQESPKLIRHIFLLSHNKEQVALAPQVFKSRYLLCSSVGLDYKLSA